jgi:hypothetical protein
MMNLCVQRGLKTPPYDFMKAEDPASDFMNAEDPDHDP